MSVNRKKTVLYKGPGLNWEERQLPRLNLEAMQRLVGGYVERVNGALRRPNTVNLAAPFSIWVHEDPTPETPHNVLVSAPYALNAIDGMLALRGPIVVTRLTADRRNGVSVRPASCSAYLYA